MSKVISRFVFSLLFTLYTLLLTLYSLHKSRLLDIVNNPLAKAGIAVGVDGIFLETHPNPAVAKSDGSNMLKLEYLEALLTKLVAIRKVVM